MKNLFLNFFDELTKNIKEVVPDYLKDNITPKNLLYRGINTLIFGWILSLYVYIPFLVYMNYHGFFSYDFFGQDGLFAINVFTFYTAFFLLSFSFLFTGSIGIYLVYHICIYLKKKEEYNLKKMPTFNWYIMPANIIIFIFTFILISENINGEGTSNNIAWVLFLFTVSIPINIHIGTLFFGSIKSQLISTIFSFGIILPIAFFNIFSGSTSKLLSIALKSFHVGGNIPIIITDKYKDIKLKGKLIFLSPKNIFLIDDKGQKVIIERNNKEIRYIKGIK